ncbi:MAG: hypothetical protein OEY44_04385, partial [Candidatus Peregrinibacteria bacterium]|nr:hypothetical protein [Candidatus Peregrinibacteria bacterium]
AHKIDEAVSKIVHEAQKKTNDILKKNKALMIKISEALLKKEVLSKEEFDAFFKGVKLPSKKTA